MVKRGWVAALIALVLVSIAGAPAGAHAELAETSPRAGQALTKAPPEIVLTFTEPVEAVPGGIRVYDEAGNRVDKGAPILEEGGGEEVLLDLPPLQDGAYIVTWRVASADSHPIRGAFTFRVGEAPGREPRALAARLLAADGGDPLVGGLHALARFVGLAALLVLAGALWFAVSLWPPGAWQREASAVIGTALIAGVVSSLALLVLQGAYAAGLEIDGVADLSLIRSTAESRFGWSIVARLAFLAVTSFLASFVIRPSGAAKDSLAGRSAVAVLGLGLLGTITLAGHAASGRWVPLGVAVDVVHLAAASLWLGGLVVAIAMLRPGAPGEAEMMRAVARFSTVAFWAVLAVLGTGTVQSIRQVGEVAALTGTTYGRLVLLKVAGLSLMVGVAAVSRRLIRRSPPDVDSEPAARESTFQRERVRSRLRRSVAVEAAIAVLIVGTTALLVNAVPGRDSLALPFAVDVKLGPDVLVDISVEPAKAGPLDLHLYTLRPDGAPIEVSAMAASLSLPERDIGPLLVPLVPAGPGHFASYGFDLPVAGGWVLSLVVEERGGRRSGSEVVLPIR